MKKTYSKKQIIEAIAYWQKQLKNGNYKKVNESTVLNEGWLGGILGFLLSGPLATIGLIFGPIGILAGMVAGTYTGHKIQEWFHKRNAVKNITDESLLILAAAKGAGADGIDKKLIDKLVDGGVKMDVIDDLIRIDALTKSGSKYKITAEGKNILNDAGYDEKAMEKTAEEIKKDAKK